MKTETQVEFRIFPGPIAHDHRTVSEWRALAKLMRFASNAVDLDAPWVGATGDASITDAKNMAFILTADAMVLGPVSGKEDACAFLCGIAAARRIPVFCFDAPYDLTKNPRRETPAWVVQAVPAGHESHGSKEAALLGCLEYLRGQRLRTVPLLAGSLPGIF